jgi:nucleoid DNA-binding protein
MEQKRVWLGDLLPTVADCAGADIDDEVRPVVAAFVDVIAGTLASCQSVVIAGLGTFNVDDQKHITFSPSRRLLEKCAES